MSTNLKLIAQVFTPFKTIFIKNTFGSLHSESVSDSFVHLDKFATNSGLN